MKIFMHINKQEVVKYNKIVIQFKNTAAVSQLQLTLLSTTYRLYFKPYITV
jgi:hypothetical protein